jgi:hypothetical protein
MSGEKGQDRNRHHVAAFNWGKKSEEGAASFIPGLKGNLDANVLCRQSDVFGDLQPVHSYAYDNYKPIAKQSWPYSPRKPSIRYYRGAGA